MDYSANLLCFMQGRYLRKNGGGLSKSIMCAGDVIRGVCKSLFCLDPNNNARD
jgi:hypothetical protein